MVPLVMAAAFGAAKANEMIFSRLQNRWKEQRTFNTVCCSIDLGWYIRHMADYPAFGKESSDRAALMKRVCALQRERDSCMQEIIALQSQLLFARFPLQTIAKVKECWALRSRFQELSQMIDSALYRGQLPQLAAPNGALGEQTSRQYDLTAWHRVFLSHCATSWSFAHRSDFQVQNYQNCISQLKRPQLTALNARLQFLYKENVERIWGQLIKRSERLMIAMAILQSSFLGFIRLGSGSFIAGNCLQQMHVRELAKIFIISSRVFGIAGFVTAIAMGFAVRSYGKLLRENEEAIEAIDRVKELMKNAIRNIDDRRFEEIVKSGLCVLERQERELKRMGRRITQVGRQIAEESRAIQELKDERAEQSLQLQDQSRELDEQESKIAIQELELKETKSKLNDQENQLTAQGKTIKDLLEKVETLQNLMMPQAG